MLTFRSLVQGFSTSGVGLVLATSFTGIRYRAASCPAAPSRPVTFPAPAAARQGRVGTDGAFLALSGFCGVGGCLISLLFLLLKQTEENFPDYYVREP